MKTTVEITFDEIEILKKILSEMLALGDINKDSFHLTAFLEKLQTVSITKNTSSVEVNDENERLKRKIKSLTFQLGLKDSLLSLHGDNANAAFSDLQINPNPIEIHGTEKGKGYDVMVSLKDVLAIESNKRIKIIYLKEPAIPLPGGIKRFSIETNESFEELLYKLQNSGHHILRVSASYAINIYHYELSEPGLFKLITRTDTNLIKKIDQIKTDKIFDVQLYHKRLMEIDRLSKSHHDFSINLKKIEEINRYKNQ